MQGSPFLASWGAVIGGGEQESGIGGPLALEFGGFSAVVIHWGLVGEGGISVLCLSEPRGRLCFHLARGGDLCFLRVSPILPGMACFYHAG